MRRGGGQKRLMATHLPLLFCMLGLAPVLSRASAMRAMPLITSSQCFLGLKEQTRWRGVSTAPTVAAFTWAEWRIRKVEANSSPGSGWGEWESFFQLFKAGQLVVVVHKRLILIVIQAELI